MTHLIEGTLPVVEGSQTELAYGVPAAEADGAALAGCKFIAADGTVQKICP